MVTLKYILEKLNVKHSFSPWLTIADVGNLTFDKVTYDQELILLENTENPNIKLRLNEARRDVYLYEAEDETVKVTRWMINKDWELDEKITILPREQVKM